MTPLRAYLQEEERIARSWVIGVLIAFVVAMIVLTTTAVLMLAAKRKHLSSAATVRAKPNPVAEVSNVHTDLFERTSAGTRLKQRQHAELGRFRWVDKKRGIIALPIDVAIDVVAAEGR